MLCHLRLWRVRKLTSWGLGLGLAQRFSSARGARELWKKALPAACMPRLFGAVRNELLELFPTVTLDLISPYLVWLAWKKPPKSLGTASSRSIPTTTEGGSPEIVDHKRDADGHGYEAWPLNPPFWGAAEGPGTQGMVLELKKPDPGSRLSHFGSAVFQSPSTKIQGWLQ